MKAIKDVATLSECYDLLIIGAGPAGLAAAATGAELGLSAVLVDENPAPGGQIYRGITTTPVTAKETLGADYWRGTDLVRSLEASKASYAPGATVWSVGPAPDGPDATGGMEVGVSMNGAARLIQARQVIAATGALERPFPIPGWTLPGVMTAGGAQIALKTSGLIPDGNVVVAGSGPLLYLLTAQLRAAGAKISVMLDTTPLENWGRAIRHASDFLRSPYLSKGLKLLLGAHRGMRIVRGVKAISAHGDNQVTSVRFRHGSKEEELPCDVLLLHQGVVPNINLANAVGCALDWDEDQLTWVPQTDDWYETSVKGFAIAGDGAGIAGAESAALRGRLAALGAGHRLGRLSAQERDQTAAPVRAELIRASRGRRFLDVLYQPAKAFRVPTADDTIVCRCEEVTAGKLRETVALGVSGPNQMKSFLRCGMGPCQGRLCGLTVTELIADARGVSPGEVGGYRLRPPIKPITLGELAALPKTPAAIKAVER
ncbi:FAD/NAD(P)-binding oxidoreductase [Microvirga sp. KLBC 81]|uniref:FAD/NAD(P)-dependent oxidoreductase n=1 Tax=Microvirga sp. KLBC 81 TaxID=1862707 RepID=UPI000D516501|nr:NAD(P)/FAD-dependent oxidoreductase [Microvirga sp. KLBC 81]PVE21751.1 FAD/NAD(P)-binding oxidoreductase [Microvirga sp. KLBC 81]